MMRYLSWNWVHFYTMFWPHLDNPISIRKWEIYGFQMTKTRRELAQFQDKANLLETQNKVCFCLWTFLVLLTLALLLQDLLDELVKRPALWIFNRLKGENGEPARTSHLEKLLFSRDLKLANCDRSWLKLKQTREIQTTFQPTKKGMIDRQSLSKKLGRKSWKSKGKEFEKGIPIWKE